MNKSRKKRLEKELSKLKDILKNLDAIEEEEHEVQLNLPDGDRYEKVSDNIEKLCEIIQDIGNAVEALSELTQ